MKTLLVAVALAGCGGGGEATSSTASTGPIRTAKVTRGSIAPRTVITGELHAGEQIELVVPKTDVFQLTIRWMAEDGTVVKAGDRVVDFDNSAVVQGLDGKKTALHDAENQFATANAVAQMSVAEKKFELDQHQIALDKAKLDASIPDDLIDKRTAQEHKLAQLKAEVALEGANRDLVAQKQQGALDAQVKQIEMDKAKRSLDASEKTLDQLAMKAPIDGVVSIASHPWTGKKLQIGDSVPPSTTVLTQPDLSKPMEVRADLSDVDDGRVAIGQKGTCTLDAFPDEPVPCEVTDLAPVARTKSRDSLRRDFAVKLAMVSKHTDQLRPGMSVRVELPPLGPPSPAGLLVPRGAIRTGADGKSTVATPGGAHDIALGACDAQNCLVTSGVSDGDTVVIGGGS